MAPIVAPGPGRVKRRPSIDRRTFGPSFDNLDDRPNLKTPTVLALERPTRFRRDQHRLLRPYRNAAVPSCNDHSKKIARMVTAFFQASYTCGRVLTTEKVTLATFYACPFLISGYSLPERVASCSRQTSLSIVFLNATKLIRCCAVRN